MWVIVRQEDWVGGDDSVVGAAGPFPNRSQAEQQLARMQRAVDERPFPDERLWLLQLESAR
jgi:hypothetical protein